MSTWVWVVIGVAAAIVIAVIVAAALRARRTRSLRARFGPEYDRVAADAPTRREAETELTERQQRREQLEIRPLPPEQRGRFAEAWRDTQARFVDDPEEAVVEADTLIQEVMRARGYPVADFEQRAADVSVDHPQVVNNYRAAHGIRTAYDRGNATTEDLRQALKHYRALFEELLEQRAHAETR